ncbi:MULTISPECIES: hypothetical protein [Planktothricoides]|nr:MULTISPECIES: hypothetical protein [Planktothricoides]
MCGTVPQTKTSVEQSTFVIDIDISPTERNTYQSCEASSPEADKT